ncbi:MAG: CcmD family protein [Ktedonobacterales bacterium]
MHGNTVLVVAYAVIWVGLLTYIGWIALRMRGIRTELDTVRALVEERDQRADAAATPE